jgi:hypothetical protein
LGVKPFVTTNQKVDIRNYEESFVAPQYRAKESQEGITNSTVVKRFSVVTAQGDFVFNKECSRH